MRKWKDCVTDDDKWRYHAEVYAWRHVRMGVPLSQPTPQDPKSEWFNEAMVHQAIADLQAKQPKPKAFTFTDEEFEERREWARLKGYADWNAFLDAVQDGQASIMPFLAWSAGRREERGPPQIGTFVRLGTAFASRAAAPIEGLPPPPPRTEREAHAPSSPIHQAHAELGVSVSEAAE